MLDWLLGGVAAAYGAGALAGWLASDLTTSAYPPPELAEEEMAELAQLHRRLCVREVIGESTEGRPLHAFRLRGGDAAEEPSRPRLLVTAHIHAVEYIGAYVARAVARRLLEGYGTIDHVTALLDLADVWMVPLVNPDGAARIWRQRGWSRLGGARYTATGVDPNRNFPYVPVAGRGGWNSSSGRRGSAYYGGPHPLSEPECMALARLCKRERFCGAINFHSFGGVVFLPRVDGADDERTRRALAVFQGEFQAHQPHCRYRPVPERPAKIIGRLEPFLLGAFGTPGVIIEVSRPGFHMLLPWNFFNVFWWANPARPAYWVENDADAAIHALQALLEQTNGTPGIAAQPQLADQVDAASRET